MLRGNSRRRVKPKPSKGWESEDCPEPIRRRLRDANIWDRLLIAFFFFVTGAIATGGIYWYLSNDTTEYRTGHPSRYAATVLPLQTSTGDEARMHFLLVCLIGGIVAVIAYMVISVLDPYGTTASAKFEDKRKQERFELLKEAGFPVDAPHAGSNSSTSTKPKSG